LDVLGYKMAKLPGEALKNVPSERNMLTDRKRMPTDSTVRKIIKHYDFFTGETKVRMLQIPMKDTPNKTIE